MIAGTLALLQDTADEPLESYEAPGFTTLDVRETAEYLDGKSVQQGRAAATIESSQEEIHIIDGDIEVEQVAATERVWTEWVADVTDAGFVVAERTHGEFPFPFDLIEARTGCGVDPAYIDAGDFISRRQQADDDLDIWFAGTKEETGELEPNNAKMAYGEDALTHDAIQSDIGVGFWTHWNGRGVKGVLYNSGYLAIYQPSGWGPEQFARFVREEILPVATADAEVISQAELESGGASA